MRHEQKTPPDAWGCFFLLCEDNRFPDHRVESRDRHSNQHEDDEGTDLLLIATSLITCLFEHICFFG